MLNETLWPLSSVGLTHAPPARTAGFGIAAQPTEFCKDLDPGANVVLHQGDVGEYLRVEDELS